MRQAIVILLALLLLSGCSYDQPVQSQGSFTIDGVTYSFSGLRVDHVGYVEGSDSSQFILRLSAFPGTMTMDTVSHKGYGIIMQLFFVASSCDFRSGDLSNRLFQDSLSHVVKIAESGDTTAVIPITDASVVVSSAENGFLHYDFILTSASGVTSGKYTGTHIANRLVDQPAFGAILFDTINSSLSSAILYRWEHLFSPELYYYEFVFYSTDSRFDDKGKLRTGMLFTLGILSSSNILPADGEYTVSSKTNTDCVMYGHKIQEASWGTCWNNFYAGSSIGKANILSGTLNDFTITDEQVTFSFDFTDQLNNAVSGFYSGSYMSINP